MQDCESQYVYISRLGEGSYGSVMLCRELSAGEEKGVLGQTTSPLVAVKRFKWAHNHNMGLRLALREIRLLKSLDHPLIIKLQRAFFSRNCRLYAVFPFIDAGCAQSVLKKRYPCGMPPVLLKSFAWQLCLALRYLHKRKVLHRDIKPANVLLSTDGTIRLGDFGFARRVSGAEFAGIAAPPQPTPAASAAGCVGLQDALTPYVQTRPYRAPEVLLGHTYGAPADIWALGATLAEMATGEVLFPGTSSLDQLWRILRALPGPRPPLLAKAVETLQRLDPAALGHKVPQELLRPKQLTGPLLLERLRGGGGGAGGCVPLKPALVDFIMACMRLDPEARLTAEELLRMPYLADVGEVVAGNAVLEGLFDGLKAEMQAAAGDAGGAGQDPAVRKLRASERFRGGDWAMYGAVTDPAGSDQVRICWSAVLGGHKAPDHPISGAQLPQPLPLAAAVAASAVAMPPPPLTLGQHATAAMAAATGPHFPQGDVQDLRVPANGANGPHHRRSLSAGNHAEAQESASSGVQTTRRRPLPPSGDRLVSAAAWPAEFWRLPPPPEQQQQQQQPYSAMLSCHDAVVATPPSAAARTAVSTRAVPIPLLSQTLARAHHHDHHQRHHHQRHYQQQLPPQEDGTLPMAMSLDSAMWNWGPWGATGQRPSTVQHPRQASAGSGTVTVSRSFQLRRAATAAARFFQRPRFRPGRVQKLQMPPPPPPQIPAAAPVAVATALPAPAAAVLTARGPNLAGKMNRNSSAPDLLQYSQDEPLSCKDVLASEIAFWMGAALMRAGDGAAVRAVVTARGAWSQSGCLWSTTEVQPYGGRDARQSQYSGNGRDRPSICSVPVAEVAEAAGAELAGTVGGDRVKTSWPTNPPHGNGHIMDATTAAALHANASPFPCTKDFSMVKATDGIGTGGTVDVVNDSDYCSASLCLRRVPTSPQQRGFGAAPVSTGSGCDTVEHGGSGGIGSYHAAASAAWKALLMDIPVASSGGGGCCDGAGVSPSPEYPSEDLDVVVIKDYGRGTLNHHHRHRNGQLCVTRSARWRRTCLGYVCTADGAPPYPAAAPAADLVSEAIPVLNPGSSGGVARSGATASGTSEGFSACIKVAGSSRNGCNESPNEKTVSSIHLGAISGMDDIAEEEACDSSGPVAEALATVFGDSGRDGDDDGDGAHTQSRSYGIHRSSCDTDEAWVEEMAAWRECGNKEAATAHYDTADAGVAAAARPLQLTSPIINFRCISNKRSGSEDCGARGSIALFDLQRVVGRVLACFGGRGGSRGCDGEE